MHISRFCVHQTLPVIVREMSRDEAIIFMCDSNLQREVILPSEKAHSLKMRLEAMKRLAGRPPKNNSSQVGMNLKGKQSLDELGDALGENHDRKNR